MVSEMDETDHKLLAAVQDEANTTQAALASRFGLSTAAVNRRLRRMTNAGFILRTSAILSPERLGYSLTVIACVEVESEQIRLRNAAEQEFASCPQVQQCYYVAGEWDYVLIFLTANMEQYTALTRALFFNNPNVKRFKTMVAMTRVKVTLDVPFGQVSSEIPPKP